MTKLYFEARFAGHLLTAPCPFVYGQACELRIEIAVPAEGRGGEIHTAHKKLKVLTWDTTMAEFVATTSSSRNFVKVCATFNRIEGTRELKQGKWISGMVVFRLLGIRHAPVPVTEAAEEQEVLRVLVSVA